MEIYDRKGDRKYKLFLVIFLIIIFINDNYNKILYLVKKKC